MFSELAKAVRALVTILGAVLPALQRVASSNEALAGQVERAADALEQLVETPADGPWFAAWKAGTRVPE